VGSDGACLIQAGALWCWGLNTNGDLGNGNAVPQFSPIMRFSTGVSAVSMGEGATCAIVSGALNCWGSNNVGQVGLDTGGGTVTSTYTLPQSLFGGAVTQVSVGTYHTCAIANGALKCWGRNTFGELGNNSTVDSSIPVTVGPLL
jgi:alpha-tubulin suppressor-like RCC1 family protein